MPEWMDHVWLGLVVKLTVWLRRHRPCTSADLAEGFAVARRTFPNDRVQREARAQAELALREMFGQRKFDA